MRVLVVAAHPDDESIGCGGSIRLHVDRGDRVDVVFLTSGEVGLQALASDEARRVRESEAAAAAAVLGISELSFLRFPDWVLPDHAAAAADRLAPQLEALEPDLVYLPHPGDDQPDHAVVLPIVKSAYQQIGRPLPLIRAFEIWAPLSRVDDAEDITAVIEQKLEAIRCHDSQVNDRRYDRAAAGLNAYRGALLRQVDYAEAFEWPLHNGAGDDR